MPTYAKGRSVRTSSYPKVKMGNKGTMKMRGMSKMMGTHKGPAGKHI